MKRILIESDPQIDPIISILERDFNTTVNEFFDEVITSATKRKIEDVIAAVDSADEIWLVSTLADNSTGSSDLLSRLMAEAPVRNWSHKYVINMRIRGQVVLTDKQKKYLDYLRDYQRIYFLHYDELKRKTLVDGHDYSMPPTFKLYHTAKADNICVHQ